MELVIGMTAFLFIVWFIVCAFFTTARDKAVNGVDEKDEANGSSCKKDDVSDVDSASDDEVTTPQSVLAHLHKNLNRSKARPRTLFHEGD
jgi:hypothetical protein